MELHKVKVLHLTTLHPSNDVRIYEKEATSLADVGFKVVVAGPSPKPSSNNVSWIALPSPTRIRLLRILLSQLFGLYAILRSDATIIHIHDPELLIVANVIRRLSNRVFIWDAHEDYYNQLHRWRTKKHFIWSGVQPFLNMILRKNLDMASRNFHCVIGATEQICSQYNNENTILVGNEVVLKNFESCKPKFENNQVLFLSNDLSDPFLLVLVRAISRIPNLDLAVAGATNDERISQIASGLIGDRFHNYGRLDRASLAEKISSSSVGIVAYPDIVTNKTNSPNKFFEFAAAGLPIICTPNESLRNLLSHSRSGLIASGYSEDEFEAALLDILKSRESWLLMSRNGKNWAMEKGNWELSKSRLISVYKTLVLKKFEGDE